jgi:signal transduction histidine kinase
MCPNQPNDKDNVAMSNESLRRQIEILQRENIQLNNQLKQLKNEQVEYLQNVSHQLVSPLNSIKWTIELTEKETSAGTRIKLLRSIYSQATISVHLAKNFALMSNLESDHTLAAMREPLESIDLCRLMVNLASDFQPFARNKNVNIAVMDQTFTGQPPVLAIKSLISQAFSNIIENAVKYSDQGTTISIESTHDMINRTITVCVSDKGIPLSEDHLEKMFTRGYRTIDAKERYPAGTGFGLYIAQKILQIHEGTIKASTDSRGRVIFSVTLSIRNLEYKARQRGPKNGIINR